MVNSKIYNLKNLVASVLILSFGIFCVCNLFVQKQSARAAAFVVTNTNATGAGSLYQAVLDANATPGADVISTTTTGTVTLTLNLPIQSPVTLNGGGLIVDGQNLGGTVPCINIASTDVTIAGLSVTNCTGSGINVDSGSNITLNNNTLTNNALNGINLNGSGSVVNQVTITNNNVNDNKTQGINISQSSNNTISNNTVTDNDSHGIFVNGNFNTVSGNTVSSNAVDGIALSGAGNNTMSGNTMSGNTMSGLSVITGSGSNTISSNVFLGNNLRGILIDGPASIYNNITQCTFSNETAPIVLSNSGNENLISATITSSNATTAALSITGTTVETGGRIEVFVGINGPEQYVGETTASNSSFNATFNGDFTANTTAYVTFKDADDNTTAFSERAIVTTDDVAPTITNINSDPSYTSATITWDTNEIANSVVNFGKTNNLGNNITNVNLTTSHSIIIPNLENNVQYFFRITSIDASSNSTSSTIRNFTTTEYAPISSPKNGDLIWNQYVTFRGSDTSIANSKINLFIDNQIQGRKDNTKADGKYSIRSDKLSYDGHRGRIKATKNNQETISESIYFTTASAETTDRFHIYPNKTDRPKTEFNVTNILTPIFFGNKPANCSVALFIDGQEVARKQVQKQDYQIKPDNNLSYGKHVARVKFFRNKQQIGSSAAYDIVVYQPYPAPTQIAVLNNQDITGLVRDGAFYQIFIDGTNVKEATAPNTGTGTASISVNAASYQDDLEHQVVISASSAQNMPASTATANFKLNKPVVVTPTPAPAPTPAPTPTPAPAPDDGQDDTTDDTTDDATDTTDDTTTDDATDDTTDPGTDTTDDTTDDVIEIPELTPEEQEEVIELENKFKEKAKEEATKNTAPIYDPITKEKIKLNPKEEEKVKDLLDKSIPKTKIDITLDDEVMKGQPTDQGRQIIVQKELNPIDLWRRIIGEKEARVGEITLQGKIETIKKLDPSKAKVIITFFSDPVVKIAQVNEDGEWKISVPIDALPPGEHTAYLGTEINGVQSDQVEIARIVVDEQEKLSSTSIFFIINIIIAAFALLGAIYFQLRKNRKLLKEQHK